MRETKALRVFAIKLSQNGSTALWLRLKFISMLNVISTTAKQNGSYQKLNHHLTEALVSQLHFKCRFDHSSGSLFWRFVNHFAYFKGLRFQNHTNYVLRRVSSSNRNPLYACLCFTLLMDSRNHGKKLFYCSLPHSTTSIMISERYYTNNNWTTRRLTDRKQWMFLKFY